LRANFVWRFIMPYWLRYFKLDRLSFWLGFLAGALIWWSFGKLRPVLGELWRLGIERLRAARQDVMIDAEIRLRNDTLRYAQHQHLAAPLFSLDEILLPPRVLAPPPPVEPEVTPPYYDISEHILPYLPDWPELGSELGAPSFTLSQTLSGGTNIVVVGQAGSGKSVALSHLAIQVARHNPQTGTLADLIPVLVHAADLLFSPQETEEPELLSSLVGALGHITPTLSQARLTRLLALAFSNGRILLLLDGLDELPPTQLQERVDYLEKILQAYPETRVIATATPDYFDGLVGLGFVPLVIASWRPEQRSAFIRQWGNLWRRYIDKPGEENVNQPIDPTLINGWLINEISGLSPFELTLKTWSAYAGDGLGPSPLQAIEAHLRRMTSQYPNTRIALENLARQMLVNQQAAVTRREAEALVKERLPETTPLEAFTTSEPSDGPESTQFPKEPVNIPRSLPDLTASGLMVPRADQRFGFAHPLFAAYLGGSPEIAPHLASQPDWTGKILALGFLATRDSQAPWLSNQWELKQIDPLLRGVFQAARWLRLTPEGMNWRISLMRYLANLLQDQKSAYGLRACALAALAYSNSNGVQVLFRQLLEAKDSLGRQLAAIGCGVIRDGKAIQSLIPLLRDPSPGVQRAALLGLVAIGSQPALEVVADALLHADEEQRRYAAEALANNAEEGYPTLEEATQVEDLLVRRAAVFGLSRVRQDWAIQILERIQVEDGQWVVKAAAAQKLEEINKLDPRVPCPLPALTGLPWLVAFAGERGMGVAPGKPAVDLVVLALKEGNEEQKLAAIYVLSRLGDSSSLVPLFQTFFASEGEIQNNALHALWQIAAAGTEIPSPVQYETV
jgi:HEAT repeat protein